MSIVEVRDLSVTLDHHSILRDVSFAIEQGESIAVTGPNGSGKTILIKSLLGIVPHDGSIVWKPDVAVGYVPQKLDADRTLPLNARALLGAKARIIGASAANIDQNVARVGLNDAVLSTQIGHLSGGQFQRTLIAFALLGDPDIVFFDEPTASIDEPGEEHIYDLIHRLRHEANITVVVVSHDPSFVRRYADRVFSVDRCSVVEIGAPA